MSITQANPEGNMPSRRYTSIFSRFLESPLSVQASYWIGANLPPALGYLLGRLVARMTATNPRSGITLAIRSNHWVASGMTMTSDELHRRTRSVLDNQSRYLFNFYHNLNRPKKLLAQVSFSPTFQSLFDNILQGKLCGLFITPHTSAIDSAGIVLALRGLKFLILAYPDPNPSYTWQYDLRTRYGAETIPFTPHAIQRARETINNGGIVLTGLERPVTNLKYRPLFFGQPSTAPVAYVRLAIKTRANIWVVACKTLPDGSYQVDCSDPVEMIPRPDPDEEYLENAERVLAVGETFIRPNPDQWMMFFPLWPGIQPQGQRG